ncbi:hypothetical protein KY495_00245 [Massilia sp. PAMC28688]|uniref:hypothetical protein n=1 Tax=Massilia sp. PAMC28688 TaxID=2861283 RepID=UPI001C6344AF|nr:hypothetical protein [Massilia sp. PAMC28688]QYF93709.1 hypothetical protein KY495_00245 [Massilia sp. PAMC28688]
MNKIDQFQIIQEIANRAISAAEPGWRELMITYYVEGEQSEFGNSYLISQDGVTREKALPVFQDLDGWMRRLQEHLAEGGKQPFTMCKLNFLANGKYEASYGYDPVDWDDLITAGWNFPSVTSLH